MKKISTFLVLALITMSATLSAQNLKFGHISLQELVSLMPERDSALVKYERIVTELDENYNDMIAEYNKKIQEFQQKSATWTTSVLETKESEIRGMQERIEQFRVNAQQDMQAKEMELMGPIYTKASDAIKKIGKEQGFIYIFDTTSGNIPYINENQSVNVLPIAKQELKIPADKVAPTQR